MTRQDLIELIKKSIEQGADRERLVSDLIFAGFNYQEIQGALNQMSSSGQLPPNFFSGTSRRIQKIPKGQHVESIAEAAGPQEPEADVKGIIGKYKKVFFITLSALVVVVGGAMLGFYLYSTSPTIVVGRALSNLSQAKTFAYYFRANAVIDINSGDPLIDSNFSNQGTVESQGVVDLSGGSAKFSSQFDVRNGVDSTSTPVWNAGIISTEPSNLYVKVDSVATTTAALRPLLGQLVLGWFKVDAPTQNLNGIIPERLISEIPLYQNLIPQSASGILRSLPVPGLISQIISIGSENINNSTYGHYRIYFNQDAFAQIAGQFYSAVGKSGGELSKLAGVPWDIWISKTESNIYRINISLGQPISGYTFGYKNIDVYLSGFNAVSPVTAPPQFSLLSHILQIIK